MVAFEGLAGAHTRGSRQFNRGSIERWVRSVRRESGRKSDGIGPYGCAPPRDAAISQQWRKR
jgi:hypothetical protein